IVRVDWTWALDLAHAGHLIARVEIIDGGRIDGAARAIRTVAVPISYFGLDNPAQCVAIGFLLTLFDRAGIGGPFIGERHHIAAGTATAAVTDFLRSRVIRIAGDAGVGRNQRPVFPVICLLGVNPTGLRVIPRSYPLR